MADRWARPRPGSRAREANHHRCALWILMAPAAYERVAGVPADKCASP